MQKSFVFASLSLAITLPLLIGPYAFVNREILHWTERGEQSDVASIAVLVVGRESREEVLITSAKSLTQHVTNPLKNKYKRVVTMYCLQSIAPSTIPHLLNFGPGITSTTGSSENNILTFNATGQFERLELCFNMLDERHGNFTFYFKTRPDIIWLEDLKLSFRAEAIMLRARRISQGRITMQHRSWPGGCDCEQSGCVMVDSMVAIVPYIWRWAYFSTSTEIESVMAKNSSESKVDEDEGRLFHLTKDWETKCPCAKFWAEGRLTLRLASHEVTVLVEAFNFVLAPPTKDGSPWRQGAWGTRVHDGNNWFTCE
ncbi:unnamed product [Ostreococcus tauri]|uniref:Unnamed product n=1 Tax=Ostreococcus tauri TaxID=70448 RepID=Q00S52_OSTTA|nr:unnamed product [Ostreococcus tauri]CAL58410.1 unnamed product [Ostreococcus tauri]|eukprot:XP_003084345.1 unnamed product [Ostreococcus tauri]